jgi:hypothetical protein
MKGYQKSMPFAVLMVQEEQDHLTDSYICLTMIPEISSKSKHSTQHPLLPSAVRRVLHSQALPVSKLPQNLITDDDNDDKPVPVE